MEFHLTWPGHEVFFDKGDVVISKLRELDALFTVERRSVLVGVDTDQCSLDIGLGILHTLVWVTDEDSPGYVSRGEGKGKDLLSFEFDTDSMEIPQEHLIAGDAALAAATEFVETLARPTGIEWDEF